MTIYDNFPNCNDLSNWDISVGHKMPSFVIVSRTNISRLKADFLIFYLTTSTLSENDGNRGFVSFSFGTSITFDSKLRVKSYSSAANLTKLIISPSFLNFSSLDL